MARPVDRAMNAQRPEKRVMRDLWLPCIQRLIDAGVDNSVPLYLTLCGAEALDIRHLIDNRLIKLTNTGAIHPDDLNRVVAVEFDQEAILSIKRLLPGLAVRETRLQSLLHGDTQLRYPTGVHYDDCRARVVNLDLDNSLEARNDDDELIFPLLQLVVKLARLHAERPRIDWTLLLTLHGEIHWDDGVFGYVAEFLGENCRNDPEFERGFRNTAGNHIVDSFLQQPIALKSEYSKLEQQSILMAFVPKKIAHLLHRDGWKVVTAVNVRYGGTNARAPMVSWQMDFKWDRRYSTRPEVIYRECVREVFMNTRQITARGALEII